MVNQGAEPDAVLDAVHAAAANRQSDTYVAVAYAGPPDAVLHAAAAAKRQSGRPSGPKNAPMPRGQTRKIHTLSLESLATLPKTFQ
jgi:hypothetical protein